MPQHHVVYIHLLRDLKDGSTRELYAGRDAETVEGIEALVASDDVHRTGTHALVQHYGKRLADPLNAGRVRLIFKGQDEQRVGHVRLSGGTPGGAGSQNGEQEPQKSGMGT